MSEKKKRILPYKLFLEKIDSNARVLIYNFQVLKKSLSDLISAGSLLIYLLDCINEIEKISIPDKNHQKEILSIAMKRAEEIEKGFKEVYKPSDDKFVVMKIKVVIKRLKNLNIGE